MPFNVVEYRKFGVKRIVGTYENEWMSQQVIDEMTTKNTDRHYEIEELPGVNEITPGTEGEDE